MASIRCQALTKDGKGPQCSRNAGSNGYCWQHASQAGAESKEAKERKSPRPVSPKRQEAKERKSPRPASPRRLKADEERPLFIAKYHTAEDFSDFCDRVDEKVPRVRTSKDLEEVARYFGMYQIILSAYDIDDYADNLDISDEELNKIKQELLHDELIYDQTDPKSFMKLVYDTASLSYTEFNYLRSANDNPRHRPLFADNSFFEIEPTGLYKIPLKVISEGQTQDQVTSERYWP